LVRHLQLQLKSNHQLFKVLALVFGLTIALGLDYGVRQIDLKFWKNLFWTRIPCGKQVRIFITGSKPVFTPSFCAMNSKVMRMLICRLGCHG